MSNGNQPVLLVQFRPAWGEQAFLRFAGISHCVNNARFPLSTAAGRLPQLQTCGKIIPQEEILRHLASVDNGRWDLDSRCGLTTEEKAQAAGFDSIIRNDLDLALDWSRWGDYKHYASVTRRNIRKAMPFPANFLWSWYERTATLLRLRNSPQHVSTEEAAKRLALRCYEALSIQLGNSKWMFGNKGPSSLDCVVFGHLMNALREPICAILLQKHPNLVQFCKRIQSEWFDSPSDEVLALCALSGPPNVFAYGDGFDTVYCGRSVYFDSNWGIPKDCDEESAEKNELSESEKDFQRGSKKAVLLAGGVLASYLLYHNFISFKFGDDGEDDLDDDED